MLYKLLLLAIFVTFVHAQGTDTATTPASSVSISPCLLGCLQNSAGCTYTDVTCVCTNTAYQNAVATCLQTTCTASDLTAALALQAEQCGAVSSSGTETSTSSTSGVSPTSTGTTTGTGTTSSKASSTTSKASSTTGTPASTTTSGAVGMMYGGNSWLQAAGVITLGALGVGFLVL